MLVIASRHEHAMPALDKPRVISELKKSKKNGKCELESKPRISGELQWAVDGAWELRHVEVRDGSLVVYSSPAGPKLRLPLRHLSLQSANHPHAFSLVREHQPIVTLLAGTDEEYERWVKTLAVELMRQTPLEAIRFLDILGITATIARTRGYEEEAGYLRRSSSEGSDIPLVNSKEDRLMGEGFYLSRQRSRFEREKSCITNCERGRAKQRVRVNTCVSDCGDRRLVRTQSSGPKCEVSDSDSDLEEVDEKEMAALLRKCQQVDNYVPVSEKRRLFESLSRRRRRLAQSSDNLCGVAGIAQVKVRRKKRTRSLHDLSRSSVAVRDICRYFETRGQPERDVSQHQNQSERSTGTCNVQLTRRRVRREKMQLAQLKQEAAECGETSWRLQQELAALDGRNDKSSASITS